MKLQAISAARIPVPNTKPVKTEQSKQIVAPYTVSFKGNPEHVIFYGAEFPDYDKKGGVANVMGYYDRMPGIESVIVQPYYRGRKDYNNYGKYTGVIEPHKFGQDCKYEGLRNAYFYSKFNFEKDNLKTETETNLDTNLQKKNILVLEEVSSAKALYRLLPYRLYSSFLFFLIP